MFRLNHKNEFRRNPVHASHTNPLLDSACGPAFLPLSIIAHRQHHHPAVTFPPPQILYSKTPKLEKCKDWNYLSN